MEAHGQAIPVRRATLMGLAGLAAAIGVGRFAFTPLLPLMQSYNGLTLAQGSVLASANYGGYLFGALLCFALELQPARMARWGLIVVAASTIAMGLTTSFLPWLILRLVAGAGSAFVLVGVSAWTLNSITSRRRMVASGWVFAGVGVGICMAGLLSLAIGIFGASPSLGWIVLGLFAVAVALLAMQFMVDTQGPGPASKAQQATALDRPGWELVACYGVFGFGYIIPATFLPTVARALVDDPAYFGWTWPVFGLAAATSTIVAAAGLRNIAPRRVWALCQIVMSLGIALPSLYLNLPSVIVSSACVGGTFMVITMAGMQEARRVGGVLGLRLMAAMTAAFAIGQLIGPLAVRAAGSAADAIRMPSLLAATLLFISALLLVQRSGKNPANEIGPANRAK